MKTLDLFSGIGGFALAGRWAGIETVQFVEIDPFCQRVLAKNFPGVPIHDDIKTFDARPFRGIDLVCGGFPCQPYSVAGKRLGAADDRALWGEMLRVITECQPRWVVGENVTGILSMGFEAMLFDLEDAGYEPQVFIVPACAVNAPHRRDRVWIVASKDTDIPVNGGTQESGGKRFKRNSGAGSSERHTRNALAKDATNSTSVGQLRWRERETGANGIEQRTQGERRECGIETAGLSNAFADSDSAGAQGRLKCGNTGREPEAEAGVGVWVGERWWEIEPCVRRGDDGVSRRLDITPRLKALGNAIVPQVAYRFLKAIVESEWR